MSEMNIYFLVFIISIVINLICGFHYSIKLLKEKLKGANEHDQKLFLISSIISILTTIFFIKFFSLVIKYGLDEISNKH